MSKRPHSTRMNGVPDDADMRAARQDRWKRDQARRVALANDPLAEKVARDLADDPRAQQHAPFFSVFDTKEEADNASIRFALDNIVDARRLRSRNGRPAEIGKLRAAFDALAATGIPLRVGNKYISKAEQHLMNTLGCTASEARGSVRRLMYLRSELGI